MTYFDSPVSKVRRVRLKCEKAKVFYKNEIDLVEEEIRIQKTNLASTSIGEQIRDQGTVG